MVPILVQPDRVFVEEDVRQAAEDVAVAMTLAGYRADFRPSSMWEVERLFVEAGRDLARVIGDRQETGHAMFALGGYVGEVVRRRTGGRWSGDDNDPNAEINVALLLRGGGTVWPVQRVMKRFANGPEDSVVAYAVGLGIDVGERPRAPGAWATVSALARHDRHPSAYRRFRRWRAGRTRSE